MATGVISDQSTLSSSHQHFQPSLCWPRVSALKDLRHSTSWGSVGDAGELVTVERNPILPSQVCNGARRLSVNTVELWTHQWTLEEWKTDNLFSFSMPTMEISAASNPMAPVRPPMTIFSLASSAYLRLPLCCCGASTMEFWRDSKQ